MFTYFAYITYLFISIVTVLVVGKSLHRNGKVYLFGECADQHISESANNFLYICYCLLNIGFAVFFLGSSKPITSITQSLEFITNSQGFIFMCLGILHVINVSFAPKIIQGFLQKKLLTNKNQKS